tara:strand:- start:406 stop:570 length:165 start_codon:yes stop_codon:yes gene_type:complete
MSNIQDVTDSAADWQDFWENEDEVSTDPQGWTKRYIESVMNGGAICKRESMLSD